MQICFQSSGVFVHLACPSESLKHMLGKERGCYVPLLAFVDGLLVRAFPRQKNSCASLLMNYSRTLFIKLTLQPPASEFVEEVPLGVVNVEISEVGLFLPKVASVAHIPAEAIEYEGLQPQIYFLTEYSRLQTICSMKIQRSQAIEFYSIGSSQRQESLPSSPLKHTSHCGQGPPHDAQPAYCRILDLVSGFQFPHADVILPISI